MAKVHDTAQWKKLRLEVLERDLWTCSMCGAALSQGCTRPDSAVVDHTRPHDLDPDGQYDPANLRSVCRSCHDGPCRSIEKRHRPDVSAIERAKLSYRAVGLDGYPVAVRESNSGSGG
ncbi:MAG: HNH endonuclease [Pikeienuella sp.]